MQVTATIVIDIKEDEYEDEFMNYLDDMGYDPEETSSSDVDQARCDFYVEEVIPNIFEDIANTSSQRIDFLPDWEVDW